MKSPLPRLAIAALAALVTATTLSASASASSSSAPLPQQQEAPAASKAPQHRDRGRDGTVTIYFTRHGQTLLNTLERVQGWSDAPLIVGTNPDGSALNARTLPFTVGKNLRAREGKIDAAYAADMKRHNETASFMLKGARQQHLTIKQDPRLREFNFGKYEGAENKEMWTAMVENLGYTVNHDLPATAPVDETGQNGGWQTMQALATKEKGLPAMMASMKEVAQKPAETGIVFPAEDCTDVSKRAMAALNSIAKNAVKHHDKRVLVVSSGLTISCTIDSLGLPQAGGISNVAISKLEYRKGQWTVKSVGDTSYRD